MARFSFSSFLFFLYCTPDGFCLFIVSFLDARLETHTQPIPINVLACSDNTEVVPLPLSIFGKFFPYVRFFFFYVKILVGHTKGGAKNSAQIFFCAGHSFWRPSRSRQPPMSPVGRAGPVSCVYNLFPRITPAISPSSVISVSRSSEILSSVPRPCALFHWKVYISLVRIYITCLSLISVFFIFFCENSCVS